MNSETFHRTVPANRLSGRAKLEPLEVASSIGGVGDTSPAQRPDSDDDEHHGNDRSVSIMTRPGRRRNPWFFVWTIPIFIVLFWLPVQEEVEDSKKGGGRAPLEDRVSVLAKHPIDFVVHATSHQRWTLPYKTKAFKPPAIDGPATPCIRLFGLNETLNKDQNLRKQLPRIKYIRIVGERNSGTRMLKNDLQRALRNVSIESGVTRWGYWFQDSSLFNLQEHPKPEETLVVHVVLEPYEWFARMQTNPIHAPYHRKPLVDSSNWTSTTFLKRPWTCARPDWDDPRPSLGHCQYRFAFDAVIPCLPGKNTGAKANKNYPVYEMHPTKHKPFSTIAHLRTAKIINFLNITTWMPHVVHVRTSDIAGLNGLNAFVSALLDRYRLSIACQVHKRDQIPKSLSTSSTSSEELSWSENPPEPLTSWQIKFITCNLDWELERMLGFNPREDVEKVCPHGYVGHHKHNDDEMPAPQKPPEEKGWLFRLAEGVSTFGRRRQRRLKN
jgi:hypothetical protein